MGLTISLQNENGEAGTQVFDSRNLLHRQLTMENEGFLGGINWYGDTTFNTLQMKQFIPEWQALIENTSDPDEIALLTQILALAHACFRDVHQYLKFEGD